MLTGVVTAFQSFVDQLRWNAHFHSLVIEGGFDEAGRFIHIPLLGLKPMTEVFRRRLIWLLVEKKLLAEDFVRPPLSLKKIRYEPFKGKVLFHTKYSDYFKENVHLFDALEFLAELTQHIPPLRVQLIRRYVVYSSRTKGRWSQMPHVAARAPEGWRESYAPDASAPDGPGFEPLDDGEEFTVNARKRAWARLLAKVYEIAPWGVPNADGR